MVQNILGLIYKFASPDHSNLELAIFVSLSGAHGVKADWENNAEFSVGQKAALRSEMF